MLHAWEKFGLDAAQQEFNIRYDKKHRSPFKQPPLFKQVVKGKIEFLGMVRGKENDKYIEYRNKLWQLAPEFRKEKEVETQSGIAFVVKTEGSSDKKHLDAALSYFKSINKFQDLNIKFKPENGNKELQHYCTQPQRICRNTQLSVFLIVM